MSSINPTGPRSFIPDSLEALEDVRHPTDPLPPNVPGDLTGAMGHFKALDAVMYRDGGTIKLTGPIGREIGATVRYDGGLASPTRGKIFVHTQAAPPHPHETRDREMTKPEMKALLASLKEELKAPPRGVDKRVLQQFVDHLEKAAKAPAASQAFDHARLADVAKDARGGGITAHFGLGRDSTGTIHADKDGKLSWEVHTVPGKKGKLKPMSEADRASLANAVEKYVAEHPRANSLWKQLLADARK